MKKTNLPSIVSILVLTLLTIILWISFSVYRAFTTAPSPAIPQEVSAPLTPTLDQDAIKQIESGIFLPSSLVPQAVTTTSLPNPAQTPIPTVTPTATPTASPSATPTL